MMRQFPDPEEMVTLAEALALAETELEERNLLEAVEREIRRTLEITASVRAEGKTELADFAEALSTRTDGPPAAWTIAEAEREVAEVKAMLTAGQDRAAVVEALLGEFPAFLRTGLLREATEVMVDSCAAELAA